MSWPLKVSTDNVIFLFLCSLDERFDGSLRSHWDSVVRASKPTDTRAQLSNTVRAVFFILLCPVPQV